MLDVDWSDGDVVFANSACFEDDLMGAWRGRLRVKPGTYFMGYQRFGHGGRRHRAQQDELGPATVFIHVRKNLDGSSFERPPSQTSRRRLLSVMMTRSGRPPSGLALRRRRDVDWFASHDTVDDDEFDGLGTAVVARS